MSERPPVLIVDDQMGDLLWLVDLIRDRGYNVIVATNEEAAQKRLRAIKSGAEAYALAIIDVMVPVTDPTRIAELNDQFFEDSRNTGIRLCQFIRRDLAIPAEQLLVACLTAREDDEVRNAMDELDIPLYPRAAFSPAESIRRFVEEHLPVAVGT